jgi:hypothetical protein
MAIAPAVPSGELRSASPPSRGSDWRETTLFTAPLATLLALAATAAPAFHQAGVAYDGGNDLSQGLLLFAAVVAATFAAWALIALLSIAGQIASAPVAVGDARRHSPWSPRGAG